MSASTASIDLSNHFLLAMPGMADPNFSGAIVLVAEHSEKGALGLVVNKPTAMTLSTLLSRIEPDGARAGDPGGGDADADDDADDGAAGDVEAEDHGTKAAGNAAVSRPLSFGIDQQIFFGGPVQGDRGFVLHDPIGAWNSTVKIGEGIALTTSRDVLEAVAGGHGPQRLLVTLGYAGWGPGQLEAEIGQNAWLTIPADPELLFETPAADRFIYAYRRLGIDPALLAPRAGHA